MLSKLIDSQLSSQIEIEAYINLNQPEDLIRSNVRKSYKSLINWGYGNLKLIVINKSNPDKDNFYKFKKFHVEVAGRQTRSNYSWDLQYKAILEGKAFLVLGYNKDLLVSGAHIIHGTDVAYYGVAVNDRGLMAENKPLGHAILFKSIIYAKEIGLQKFILGNIETSNDNKINDIIKYKKGFTNTLASKAKYLVQL